MPIPFLIPLGMLAGAGIGAMTNKDNRLKGALLGGAAGGLGGMAGSAIAGLGGLGAAGGSLASGAAGSIAGGAAGSSLGAGASTLGSAAMGGIGGAAGSAPSFGSALMGSTAGSGGMNTLANALMGPGMKMMMQGMQNRNQTQYQQMPSTLMGGQIMPLGRIGRPMMGRGFA